MFLNGADYNVVSPFLWIYCNIFLCHINSFRGKSKTLTPPPNGIRVFNMLFSLRLQNILNTLHLRRLVTMQRYELFSNPARNVNSELTFGRACSELRCRKIAAMRKSLCHNTLCAKSLRVDGCQIVVLNVVGSSPTGHPTIKVPVSQRLTGIFVFGTPCIWWNIDGTFIKNSLYYLNNIRKGAHWITNFHIHNWHTFK